MFICVLHVLCYIVYVFMYACISPYYISSTPRRNSYSYVCVPVCEPACVCVSICVG